MSRTFEEYGVFEESQEGARRGRGAKRQVLKLQQIYDIAKRCSLKVAAAFIDFNIAFTGLNHDCVYETAEAMGMPSADIELLKSMDNGAWYSVSNPFGESAACVLRRGRKQGCPPSPILFNASAMNTLIAYLNSSGKGWRAPQSSGWYAMGSEERSVCPPALAGTPDPSSAYLDDMALITVGPNTVADMQVLVTYIERWELWSGVTVNLDKTRITAIDFANGQILATDSILYRGSPFIVTPPTDPVKYLGVRTTMTMDFKYEKEHVLKEMDKRLEALSKAPALSASHLLMVLEFGIASVFRYSAGLTPWSKAELEKITSKWVQGGKLAWTLAPGTDSSLIRLCNRHGGRGCPNAVEVWTNDAAGLIEQCRRTPGVIADMTEASLIRNCRDHGCVTLFQLQRALRLESNPATVVENLLCRLDERGLDVHGRLPPADSTLGPLITEVLWPKLWEARQKREDHAGCRELPDTVKENLEEAKRCLKAVRVLAAFGILHVSQLLNSDGCWLTLPSVARTKVPAIDYNTMIRWLGAPDVGIAARTGQRQLWQELPGRSLGQPPMALLNPSGSQSFSEGSECGPIPAHVAGKAKARENHDLIVLDPLDHSGVGDPLLLTTIAALSDTALASVLCDARAVLVPPVTQETVNMVECLSLVDEIAPSWTGELKLVLGEFGALTGAPRLVTARMAVIRQWLISSGRLTVQAARWRPSWSVPASELEQYYHLQPEAAPPVDSPQVSWRLGPPGAVSRQCTLSSTVVNPRTRDRMQVPTAVVHGGWKACVVQQPRLHPWQCNPHLPSTVSFDFTSDVPTPKPCPDGWVILQRNGSVEISSPAGVTCQVEAAQYSMLAWLGREVEQAVVLAALQQSCEA